MREELLQLIWANGLFNQQGLNTSDGQIISIESRGVLNTISGPDFSEARIKIGDTLWIGNVEIHVKASEWNQHKHQQDPAYNNVILHVVFEFDAEVHNAKGEQIPVLELNGRIPRRALMKYDLLKREQHTIPCHSHFKDFPSIQFSAWLDRLVINRLESKSANIELSLNQSNGNWLQAFYETIAGYLGQNTNKLAFQELARTVPFSLLSKHFSQPLQIEALLFGASRLLPDNTESAYPQRLASEWNFLRQKHGLKTISSQWKFGGIRPDAFPTRRIQLLSMLLPSIQSSYNSIMMLKPISFPSKFLGHEFWKKHYTFDKQSVKTLRMSLSKGLKDLIMINAIAPFTFLYGRQTGSQEHIDEAIDQLYECEKEVNKYTKIWANVGFDCQSAADSQAIIELTTQYCLHKNCVLCPVGKSIITKP